jgi:hypothetical protein
VAGLAGLEHDPGADLLAVLRVGHAEHLHVLHLGVAVQEFLDLARVDVLAAADQHVLDAADDVAIALGVDGGQVAGVHPAVASWPRACGLRRPSSPASPSSRGAQLALLADGQVRPSASTIFTSRCGWMRPTVETRLSSGSSVALWKDTGLVSVMP